MSESKELARDYNTHAGMETCLVDLRTEGYEIRGITREGESKLYNVSCDSSFSGKTPSSMTSESLKRLLPMSCKNLIVRQETEPPSHEKWEELANSFYGVKKLSVFFRREQEHADDCLLRLRSNAWPLEELELISLRAKYRTMFSCAAIRGVKRLTIAFSQNIRFPPEEPDFPLQLESLRIIENGLDSVLESLPTFSLPNLTDLYLRSTFGCGIRSEDAMKPLSKLSALKHLTLVIEAQDWQEARLDSIVDHLPPGLETLRFRGPCFLTVGDRWKKCIQKFGDSKFLPKLNRLSFMLDLRPIHRRVKLWIGVNIEYGRLGGASLYDESRDEIKQRGIKFPILPLDDRERKQSKRSSEQLLGEVREKRKHVTIEPFTEPYPETWPNFAPIDDRWETA